MTAIIGLSFFLLAGCNRIADTVNDPTDSLQKQWEVFKAYWESENTEALANMYTPDGTNIPPGYPVCTGREEITQFYQLLFDNHASSHYTHQIKSVEYAGNLAIEYGEFQVDWVRNDSAPWTFKARSITHWVKDEKGKWAIKYFLFNNPPANRN